MSKLLPLLTPSVLDGFMKLTEKTPAQWVPDAYARERQMLVGDMVRCQFRNLLLALSDPSETKIASFKFMVRDPKASKGLSKLLDLYDDKKETARVMHLGAEAVKFGAYIDRMKSLGVDGWKVMIETWGMGLALDAHTFHIRVTEAKFGHGNAMVNYVLALISKAVYAKSVGAEHGLMCYQIVRLFMVLLSVLTVSDLPQWMCDAVVDDEDILLPAFAVALCDRFVPTALIDYARLNAMCNEIGFEDPAYAWCLRYVVYNSKT